MKWLGIKNTSESGIFHGEFLPFSSVIVFAFSKKVTHQVRIVYGNFFGLWFHQITLYETFNEITSISIESFFRKLFAFTILHYHSLLIIDIYWINVINHEQILFLSLPHYVQINCVSRTENTKVIGEKLIRRLHDVGWNSRMKMRSIRGKFIFISVVYSSQRFFPFRKNPNKDVWNRTETNVNLSWMFHILLSRSKSRCLREMNDKTSCRSFVILHFSSLHSTTRHFVRRDVLIAMMHGAFKNENEW